MTPEEALRRLTEAGLVCSQHPWSGGLHILGGTSIFEEKGPIRGYTNPFMIMAFPGGYLVERAAPTKTTFWMDLAQAVDWVVEMYKPT